MKKEISVETRWQLIVALALIEFWNILFATFSVSENDMFSISAVEVIVLIASITLFGETAKLKALAWILIINLGLSPLLALIYMWLVSIDVIQEQTFYFYMGTFALMLVPIGIGYLFTCTDFALRRQYVRPPRYGE